MRDLDLLNTFTEQSLPLSKPAKLDAGRLDPYSFDINTPPPTRQVFTNAVVPESLSQVGDFEAFAVAVPVDDEPNEEQVAEATTEATTEETKPSEADALASKQKLSFYSHQGDVPPGFKAASSCTNCTYFIWWEYEHEHFCSKYDFPCTPNYTCDDFKSKREAEEEANERLRQQLLLSEQQESEEEVVTAVESDKKEVYTDDVQDLIDEYKEVIQKFSDGALAGEILTLTKSRFNKRSIFADAFLDMHYRNEYKRRNGTLEGAFIEG